MTPLTIITTVMAECDLVKFILDTYVLSSEHILTKLPSSTRHLPSIHNSVDYNNHCNGCMWSGQVYLGHLRLV